MTPEELAEASKCFLCISGDMQGAVMLYLLDQIRIQNGGSVMTTTELQEAAKCFTCLNDKQAVITYQLDQILSAQS